MHSYGPLGVIAGSTLQFGVSFLIGAWQAKRNVDIVKIIDYYTSKKSYNILKNEEYTRLGKVTHSVGNAVIFTAFVDLIDLGLTSAFDKDYMDVVYTDPASIAGYSLGFYMFSKKHKPKEPKEERKESIAIRVSKIMQPKPIKMYGESLIDLDKELYI